MPFGNKKKLAGEDLKNFAGRLLAGRALTAGELKQKLRERAEKPGEVAGILASLKAHGLVDDRRLAQWMAGSRAESGTVGRNKALAQLLRKRVAPGEAQRAVDEAYSGKDESAMISAYLERKYRGKDLRSMLLDKSKLLSVYRRLRTAGFSGGASIRVLKRFAAEAEQLEDMEEGG